ncbi:MAG: hypothetical protein AB7T49_09010 [Oligoflexales bacterium]
MRSLRSIAFFGVLALMSHTAVWASSEDGTGAGMNLQHIENDVFDFHIGYPPNWTLTEMPNKWILEKSSGSRVIVEFVESASIDAKEDVLALAIDTDGGEEDDWEYISEGPFLGYSRGFTATRFVDYYFSNKRLVIRLEKIANSAEDIREMGFITGTIDRASSGPEVLSFVLENPKPQYLPGDRVCYLLKVDDLKGSIDETSLREFSVEGQRSNWELKDEVRWIPEQQTFKVCLPVGTNFSSDGLQISSLTLQNDRGQDTQCGQTNGGIICRMGAGQPKDKVSVEIPEVVNPRVDRIGPVFGSLSFDTDTLALRIDARDDSRIQGGAVESTREFFADLENGEEISWRLYSDEFIGGEISKRLDRAQGWVTLSSIALFDENGYETRLAMSHNACKEKQVQSLQKYFLIDSDGKCTQSDFNIITYFAK